MKTGINKKKVVLFIILILLFPFCVDQLYGNGYLKFYPNHFSAETWFSFIASYFSAAVMGGLTIYQAYLIDKKDRQLQQVLNRNRFSVGEAVLNRFNVKTEKIGEDTIDRIRKELLLRNRKLGDCWKEGHILVIPLNNHSQVGIQEISCDGMRIGSEQRAVAIKKGDITLTFKLSHDLYKLWLYWIPNDKQKDTLELERYYVNDARKDVRYDFLDIYVDINIMDQENEVYKMQIKLLLQSQQDIFKMQSRISSIYEIG